MRPLCVRAVLRNGIVVRDPWSPTLDGIVAAVVMRERLGEEDYVLGGAVPSSLTIVEGLPFVVRSYGDHWWYAVSSPVIVDEIGRERRHYHRRFDDHEERFLRDGVRRVMTAAGPYKGSRLVDTRVLCHAVEWHAVGDAVEVERLVRDVVQIGGRRAVGYGEVVRWEIDETGDMEIADRHRPLPVEYAAALGIEGPVMPWGLAPPLRIHQVECVMPDYARA